MNTLYKLAAPLLVFFTLHGCASVNNFGLTARQGDTIAVGLGYLQNTTRNDIKVVIRDFNNVETVYSPGDSRIRTLHNVYPDPLAKFIVNKETGIGATTMANLIEGSVTNGDKDYSQTILVLDLPGTMAAGAATLTLTDTLDSPILNPATGLSMNPVNVLILDTAGAQDSFQTQEAVTIQASYLRNLERASHYTVKFTGNVVPYAVQIEFLHDPDAANGGTGKAFVTYPRADIKNVAWSDANSRLRVVITPGNGMRPPQDFSDLKFFVAGGITGLIADTIEAYDVNGNVIQGITPIIE